MTSTSVRRVYLRTALPDLAQLAPDDPVRQCAPEAERLALETSADDRSARWWLRSANFCYLQGALKEAEMAATRALQLALPRGDEEAVVSAWAVQTLSHLRRGNYGLSRFLLDQVTAVAASHPDSRIESIHRELRGSYLRLTGSFATGEFVEAETLFREAIERYAAVGDQRSEARAFEGLVRAICGQGLYRKAVEWADRGLERCYQTGEWRYCGALLSAAASALSDEGCREGIVPLFKSALEWSRFVGNSFSHLLSLFGLGRHYSYEMQPGARSEVAWRTEPLQMALRQSQELEARPITIFCHVSLAGIYQKAGNRVAERYHRQQADELSRNPNLDPTTTPFDLHDREIVAVQLGLINRTAAQLLKGMESSPDPFFVFDPVLSADNHVVELRNELRNTAATRALLGAENLQMLSELAGHPLLRGLETPLYAAVKCGEYYQDEICVSLTEGETVWWDRRVAPSENGALLTLRDVSESHHLRELTEKLAHSALTDALTSLPNRTAFLLMLEQITEHSRETGHTHVLCYLDLDRFKAVNDSGGHAAGDALLRQVADLLKRHCSEADYAARLGGDEFAIILYQCTLDRAQTIAMGMVEALGNLSFFWRDRVFKIGASIGLTEITRLAPHPDSLVGRADAACYAAKTAGRSQVAVWEPSPELHPTK